MRRFSLGPLLLVATLAVSAPAGSQPNSSPPADEATAVSELVVRAAPLRPQSDVPRYNTEQIGGLATFAREKFNLSLRNEGRAERGRVTVHGDGGNPTDPNQMMGGTFNPTVGPNEAFGNLDSAKQMMGVAGAAEGRRRQLFRQLQRAAETADKATEAADRAYAAFAQGRGGAQQMMAAERTRETAVKTMLAARDAMSEGIEAADSHQWNAISLLNEASDRSGQQMRAQIGDVRNGPIDDGDNGPGANGFVPYVQPRVGLSRADQEAVFTAMDRREYRLAAEAATKNLKFENVAAARVSNDLVRVSGQITNTADVAAPIPPFNVVFYDQDNQIFAGAVVQPDTRGAPPNSKRRFSFDVAAAGGARISRVAVIFGQTAVPLATASR